MNKMIKKMAGGLLAAVVMLSGVMASAVTLSPDVTSRSGVAATYTTVQSALTYTFRNNGKTLLDFRKTGDGTSTVTITTTATVNGLAVADQTFTVDATDGQKFAGPFNRALFEDGSGDITFSMTNTAGATVAVVQLP